MKRRTLIASALAAPLVFTTRKSIGALLYNSHQNAKPRNLFADFLSGVLAPTYPAPSAGQWSIELNQIGVSLTPGGRHYDDPPFVKPEVNWAYYVPDGSIVQTNSNRNPWGYSSGVHMDDQLKYFYSGGGHLDFPSTEIQLFDYKKLSWTRTDDSVTYSTTPDNTLPWSWTGDTLNGVSWAMRKNANGRFAPGAMHIGGGNCYMKDLGLVQSVGYAPWPAGNNANGIGVTCANASTGLWEDPPNHAFRLPPSGPGSNGLTTDFNHAEWLTHCPDQTNTGTFVNLVFRLGYYGGNYVGLLHDPVNNLWNSAGQYFGSIFASDLPGRPTVIPDPLFPGFRALVATASSLPASQIFMQNKIDAWNVNPSLNGIYQSTANTGPSLSAASVWIYMGYDRPGSTQIFIFDPATPSSFWILDSVSFTWANSGSAYSLTGTAPSFTDEISGNNGMLKRMFYSKAYDVFGVFLGVGYAGGIRQGSFYCFPRPTQVT